MSIRKTKDGWKVDLRPNGRDGKRVRRTFKTQAEARRFENRILASVGDGSEYAPPRKDRRRLMDFVQLWYDMHGVSLRDNTSRLGKLRQLATLMGNPIAATITPMDAAQLRQKRLNDGRSPNTVNHDIAHLRAVFNVAIRLGEWHDKNPFAAIKAIRLPESELTYLTDEQIASLFDALRHARPPDTALVTEICLTTGARWSEAQTLRGENVRHGRITYVGTKNGRNRTIPIAQDLYDRLQAHGPRVGRLFPHDCYQGFTNALERAGIELPKGQRTHVLRHTFASHFMMNGGNLLALQKILGHQSVQMTMRYAHLSPDHLKEAVQLGPKIERGQNVDTAPKETNSGRKKRS